MSNPVQENAATPYNPPDEERLSGIDLVLRRRENSLLSRAGVTGVAAGKSPSGDPVIVVYLLEQKFGADIPQMLEGYRVVTQVTGTIRAQGR